MTTLCAPALAAAIAGSAGLLAVGLISWRRTSALRRGRPALRPGRPDACAAGDRAGSSRATFLAAWVGASVAASATARLGAPDGAAGTALCIAALAWGLVVVVAGLVARVVSVTADTTGLRIAYAARPDRSISWSRIIAVVPPRWPLGAWRIRSPDGAPGLMPSDLLGNEDVLAAAIRCAGLRFDGRSWMRVAQTAGRPVTPRSGAAPPPRRGADRSGRPRSGPDASIPPPRGSRRSSGRCHRRPT
jgi:hypothetical protein